MRENTLKQQLHAGKAAFGVMCTFPSRRAFTRADRLPAFGGLLAEVPADAS
jgi:hypothetical protein